MFPRTGDLGCSLQAAVMALVVALLVLSSAMASADGLIIGYDGGSWGVVFRSSPGYGPSRSYCPRPQPYGHQPYGYTLPPAYGPRDRNQQLSRQNRVLYWEDKVREEAWEAQEAYAEWQDLRATWDGSNRGLRRINSAEIHYNNEVDDVRRAKEKLWEARAGY